MKYIPKVYIRFKFPDGSTRGGFFRQWQRLGGIIASFGVEGKTELDQSKSIGQLGLKHDDVIVVSKENAHPSSLLNKILKR